MFPPDVVVVGAGFAGLSAAVRLASRGARVVVVEERRRLGGRATSFQDAVTGELVDNGQHAIFGCYHATFEFLRTIGALDDVRLEDRLEIEIVDRAGVNSCLRSTSLPPPLRVAVLPAVPTRPPTRTSSTWSSRPPATRRSTSSRRCAP